MKKISLLILVAFLFFTFPLGFTAYAADDFTVTNFIYDTSTNAGSFDSSIDMTGNGPQRFVIYDFTQGDDQIGWTGTVDGANFTCVTTHCSFTLVGHFFIPDPILGDELYVQSAGTPNLYSTHFIWTLPVTPTPTPSGGGGGGGGGGSVLGAATLEPTQQAHINEAVSSIPNTAGKEIFSILPIVLPFILVVVAIGIAFLFVKKWMKHGNMAEGGETENSWVDSSEGIHEHLENRHVE